MLKPKEYLEIIESGLQTLPMPSHLEGLYEPIRYTLAGGGKRIRPTLTLAVADALGCPTDRSLNTGLGLEMFHNFTLMHDDVMDRADVRRGRPTVHKKWDETTAILSGDAMLVMAGITLIRGLNNDSAREALDLYNRTAMEIFEGQQLDMNFEQRNDVTVDEYIEMIRLKTSVLLGCACEMGAIVADTTKEQRQAFYRYGERLGLAFQLQDDYLDTFGDPAVFGKQIGGDILNDKKTWLLINAMAERPEEVKKAMAITDPQEKIEAVKAIYRQLQLPERAATLIEQYSKEAIEALEELGLSPEAKEFFTDLALKASKRNH